MKTALILVAILLSQSVFGASPSFNGLSIDIVSGKIINRTFSVPNGDTKMYLTFDAKGLLTVTIEDKFGYLISSDLQPIKRIVTEGPISYLAEPLEGCYTLDGKRENTNGSQSIFISSFHGTHKPKAGYSEQMGYSLIVPPMQLFIKVSEVNHQHVTKITKDPYNY